MNIKRIAEGLNFGAMVFLVILGILWAGSYLSEQRLNIIIIFLATGFLNLGALIVKWIYERGEKAGRETTK